MLGAPCLAALLMLDQNGGVETVQEDNAERLRDAYDGIGAVLGFRVRG